MMNSGNIPEPKNYLVPEEVLEKAY